ncbi:TatD family deoxyribonuclease [Macrococcoides caseolyticum]|uniref:TatD family hydrolase n=1 Tax=Macrococcoides caseolyticum TaxID=69966 RepID=UPI00105CAC4A|nr:TatD family hydrolase [Macrococcus caseolyticus]TDM26871.1 TatD family deoxyribonuclease [Macrococcus caseolyticus]
MIDAHIHIDQYSDKDIQDIMAQNIQCIAVATDLKSCYRLLALKNENIHIALGYHPEQLIDKNEVEEILRLIDTHHHEIVAIGEVGLPHYLMRQDQSIKLQPYIDILEAFMHKARAYQLPVIVHAVYDDARIVMERLREYQIQKAHFHWFKADKEVFEEVLNSDYMVSATPDILWNVKTRRVAQAFPLHRLMIETDGPWPHEGFEAKEIKTQLSAIIKELELLYPKAENIESIMMYNTKAFYRI